MNVWNFAKWLFDKLGDIGFGKSMEKIISKNELTRAESFNLLGEMVLATIVIVVAIALIIKDQFMLAFLFALLGVLIWLFFGILCFIFCRRDRQQKR